MTQAIHLQRHQDVNNTSGTGRVWEGVVFSNGWIAGKWNSEFPSYGWYPSLEHLEAIHGHSGSTELVFDEEVTNGHYLLIETNNADNTTDGNPWVAEGFEFGDEWIVLLQLAKHTSVYWYQNNNNLMKVIGDRSTVHRSQNRLLSFPSDSAIWQREKIFKLTKTGVSNV
jgi:hypothetical protein